MTIRAGVSGGQPPEIPRALVVIEYHFTIEVF
jgi:hypothetical protein